MALYPRLVEQRVVHHRARVATKSPLGEALTYIAKYWDGLKLFLTDGRIEIDNNSVERTIRPIALNRKNALFAGHDAGAENWATIASLVETCKLNAIDPLAYPNATLTAIANGHKQSRIEELLPWNYSGRTIAVGPKLPLEAMGTGVFRHHVHSPAHGTKLRSLIRRYVRFSGLPGERA